MGRVTETEGPADGRAGPRTISGSPEIGEMPLPDYVRMAHPEFALIVRRSLHWMQFTLFVAGLFFGLLVGRLLA